MTNLAFRRNKAVSTTMEMLRKSPSWPTQINAANHRLLKLIAKFDRRKGLGDGGTVRSCAHWLNWKCGIALGAAKGESAGSPCLEAPCTADRCLFRRRKSAIQGARHDPVLPGK